MNDTYKERFGFPLILVVCGRDKHSILAVFERRLNHTPDEERAEALAQLTRIGGFRLSDLNEKCRRPHRRVAARPGPDGRGHL
ncbi:2-oxo-4-hydroxy-4-carboxy-5-ureidoimidazoline decarboxylase [Oricola nitratireducens]|uniref:2-oxo-4-hydroxy-4-carboxy-5-ureidoimidazoline decarboxylase n=1 Tax=Oricola nitratireducens TaxID=2775868 RepID=UPI001AEDDC34